MFVDDAFPDWIITTTYSVLFTQYGMRQFTIYGAVHKPTGQCIAITSDNDFDASWELMHQLMTFGDVYG